MIAPSNMLRVSLAASLLALALSGCGYDHHDHCMDGCGNSGGAGGTPNQPQVPQATIDTGATIGEIKPGEGAGAFVEYAAGGKWHVFTACDTKLSGLSCRWDIITSVGSDASISGFQPDSLEPSDYLDWNDSRSVRLVADNTNDIDGYYLEATPGGTVRVDVYLDDQPQPRFIYWVGEGGLHQGAPSNPIDLTPSSP